MSTRTTASGTAYRLLQRLSRGMQLLLLAFIAALATGLLWRASTLQDGGVKDFLRSIATGLLVSAAFGFAQALVTGRVTTELLRTSIVNEVAASLSQSNQAFFPTHDFPASPDPDPAFNVLLTQDLQDSSMYWFRGLTSRYSAARLAMNQSASLQARLILPDPQVHNTLDGRVDYADRQGLYPHRTREEIKESIYRDFKLGIVGLYVARHRAASVELILTPMPLLDRYEIFRNSIWVTLFSDKGPGMKFPRTLRYTDSSVLYRLQEADCLQTRLHPAARIIELSRRSTDVDLASIFTEVFGYSASEDELTQLEVEFQDFVKRFQGSVGWSRSK